MNVQKHVARRANSPQLPASGRTAFKHHLQHCGGRVVDASGRGQKGEIAKLGGAPQSAQRLFCLRELSEFSSVATFELCEARRVVSMPSTQVGA